jgi:hypothetical protein
MQNSPSHVNSCTGPSFRIVSGISAIARKISFAFTATPVFSAFALRKASRSRGGYSFVVTIVHSTDPKNTAAPI